MRDREKNLYYALSLATMNSQVIDYIDKNKDRFLEVFKELLRIESVSTQPDKKPEILKCAELEAKKFKEAGLENVRLLEIKNGYPLVYGDWLHAKEKPTILIYGHYDVQPPDPLGEWKTPPFEPTIRDGNIYARGADDNKGQHLPHLFAVEAWLKTVGRLPVNVKFVLEGEEEIGSPGISKYVYENGKFLACDAVMVSDGPWHDFEHPTIAYSLKGLMYFEVRVKGPTHDVHSGLFGGLVRNPIHVLSWILAKFKDENEHILVPGFYDDVQTMTAADRKAVAEAPFDEKAVLKETGVPALTGEKGYSPLETNSLRPTLDVCGIWGGYQEVGAKTIIPATAGAKVSIRVTGGQDPKKIERQVKEYVKSLVPAGAVVEVEFSKAGPALFVDRNNFYLQKTAGAFETAFGKKTVFIAEGASIPVASAFQEVLKAPVILANLGLPDDRLHSPNEKMSLNNFFGGIRWSALTLEALGESE